MDKNAALQSFFSQFLPSYNEIAIYSMKNLPVYPYITYEGFYAEYDDDINATTNINFSTWYREAGLTNIYKMTDRIAKAIPRSGLRIPVDNGYIIIKKASSPFGSLMGEETDDLVKRMLHSISITTFTT